MKHRLVSARIGERTEVAQLSRRGAGLGDEHLTR